MSSLILVLDANIIIRSVLGSKVRNFLIEHNEKIDFLTPDLCLDDAEEYLPSIFKKKGLPVDASLEVLNYVKTLFQDCKHGLLGMSFAKILRVIEVQGMLDSQAFHIANKMIIEATVNDQSQPEQDITLDQSACTDYTFTGLKATVKLREKFPGTENYFNWIDISSLEVNDKMTIYICQGLRLGGIADPMVAGVVSADHWGDATLLKSEWDSWDYKCGKTKADQRWGWGAI